MAADGQCRVTKEEARRIIRRLELEAYSAIVTAFRAQGDLSKTKKSLLQELAAFLCISTERHRAEVRRVVNDDRLSSIAECIHGYDTETDWVSEGRRLVSLMPRLVPQTALTAKATINANSAAGANSKAAARFAEMKRLAAAKEAAKELAEDLDISGVDNQSSKREDVPKSKKRKKAINVSGKSLIMTNHTITPPKIISSSYSSPSKIPFGGSSKLASPQSKFHSKPIILQRNTGTKSVRLETSYTPGSLSEFKSSPKPGSSYSDRVTLIEGGEHGDTSQKSESVFLTERLQSSTKTKFKPPAHRQRPYRQMSTLPSSYSSHLDGMPAILTPPQSIPITPISPVKTQSLPLSPSSQSLSGTVKLVQLPKSILGSTSPRAPLSTKSTVISVGDGVSRSPAQRVLTLSSVAASLTQQGKLSTSAMQSASLHQGAKLVSVTKSVPVAAGFKMIAVTTIVAGTTQVRTVYIATPIMSLTKTISQMTSNVITSPAALSGKAGLSASAGLTIPKLQSGTSMQKLVTSLTGVSMPNLITCLASGILTPSVTTAAALTPTPLVISSGTSKSVAPLLKNTLGAGSNLLVNSVTTTTPVAETQTRSPGQPLVVSKVKVAASLLEKPTTADKEDLVSNNSVATLLGTGQASVNLTIKANSASPEQGAVKSFAQPVVTAVSSHPSVLSDVISTINSARLLFSSSATSTSQSLVKSTAGHIVYSSPAASYSAPGERDARTGGINLTSIQNNNPVIDQTKSQGEDDSIMLAGEKFLQLLTRQLSEHKSPTESTSNDFTSIKVPLAIPSLPAAVLPQASNVLLPSASLMTKAGDSSFGNVKLNLTAKEPLVGATGLLPVTPTPEIQVPSVDDHQPLSLASKLAGNCDSILPVSVQAATSPSTVCSTATTCLSSPNVTTVSAQNTVNSLSRVVTALANPVISSSGETAIANMPLAVRISTDGATSSCAAMDALKCVRSPLQPALPVMLPAQDNLDSLSNAHHPATNSHTMNPDLNLVPESNENCSDGGSRDSSCCTDNNMLSLPPTLCDSQNNEVIVATNGRKRKGQGESSPRQLSGWIRSAILLLQKVCRYRGAHKHKGELNAAAWFIRPVDPKDAPGYFKLIKHPMDFGTVRKKLESGQYKEYCEFYDDMQLIKTNCHTYNPPEHVARKDCDAVFEYFENEYKKLLERWHRCHVSPSKKQKMSGADASQIETEP